MILPFWAYSFKKIRLLIELEFMRRLFTNINPRKAFLYFNIIPNCSIILFLIMGLIMRSLTCFAISVGLLILYFYFILYWRMIIGKVSYHYLRNKKMRTRGYSFFIIISIFNFLYFPLYILFGGYLIFLKPDGYFLFLSVLFLVILINVSNYLQMYFVSRNIALLKYKKPTIKSEWPIN
jgi:hypothetical protein